MIPLVLLRLQALWVFGVTTAVYRTTAFSLGVFALCFFLSDLSLLVQR